VGYLFAVKKLALNLCWLIQFWIFWKRFLNA